MLFRSPRWRPASPLVGPIVLACAAYGLSAATSERPRLSLEPLLGGLAIAVLALFASVVLRDAWFRRRIGALIVTGTVVVAVAYLAAAAFEWARFYAVVPATSLPPLRPNWVDLGLGSPNWFESDPRYTPRK